MKESTNQFDPNGVEIFVDTTVAWSNGFFSSKEQGTQKLFGLYKITKVVEHNVIRYNLGNISNRWEGKDVIVVSDEDFQKHGFDYSSQFYMKDGMANKFTLEVWLGKESADELRNAWMDAIFKI